MEETDHPAPDKHRTVHVRHRSAGLYATQHVASCEMLMFDGDSGGAVNTAPLVPPTLL
jgi:hypothetical protein